MLKKRQVWYISCFSSSVVASRRMFAEFPTGHFCSSLWAAHSMKYTHFLGHKLSFLGSPLSLSRVLVAYIFGLGNSPLRSILHTLRKAIAHANLPPSCPPCILFENHQKCLIWYFLLWHFPPKFVLLKMAFIVFFFSRRLQTFKMRLFMWFSNTVLMCGF